MGSASACNFSCCRCFVELFLGVPDTVGRSIFLWWVWHTGGCSDRAVIPDLTGSADTVFGDSCRPTARSSTAMRVLNKYCSRCRLYQYGCCNKSVASGCGGIWRLQHAHTTSPVYSFMWVSCTKQHKAFKAAESTCKVVVISHSYAVQTPMSGRHGDWQIATPSLTSECVVLKLEVLFPAPFHGRL